MSEGTILIIAAAVIIILIVWILRARSRDGERHVDTSVTAVGAATDVARNLVEDVARTVEDSLKADVAVSGAPAGDVQATASNAAAIMASGGASVGAVTLTDIGVPSAKGEPDNLRQLKGVGPKLGLLLTQLGVTRFDQIAAWTDIEVAAVDAHLGTFKGRIVRDDWVEQARLLTCGDVAGFEAKFGKLDGNDNH